MKAKIKATWTGSFKKGNGIISSETSLMDGMGFHFMKRPNIEAALPEEFLAAAYSSCFSMTLANLLSKENYVVNQLDVVCVISYDDDNVEGAEVSVTGNVHGITDEKFHALANEAKAKCPVGKIFVFPTNLNVLLS